MMSKSLKPFIWIGLLVLVVGLACSVQLSDDPTPTPVPTATATLPPTATPVPPTPTSPPPPPTNPPPPEPPPTREPSPENTPETPPDGAPEGFNPDASQPGEIYFSETFEDAAHWEFFMYYGNEEDFSQDFSNGRMVTRIDTQDTSVYYLLKDLTFSDIRIDITVENRGANTNYVGMVCRYSEEGWYEVNILNTGEYFIYFYDGVTNTLNELFSGGSTLIKTGKSVNDYTMICKGEELTVGINGTEVRTVELKTGEYNFLDQGQVGLSVTSTYALPVLVEIQAFSLSVPH
jgi:hypothetical protein